MITSRQKMFWKRRFLSFNFKKIQFFFEINWEIFLCSNFFCLSKLFPIFYPFDHLRNSFQAASMSPRTDAVKLCLQTVWPDLANFCHFGKFLTVYFLFGKVLSLLWQICDIIWLIFIVSNGPILKNNLTIWSHCLQITRHRSADFGNSNVAQNFSIRFLF